MTRAHFTKKDEQILLKAAEKACGSTVLDKWLDAKGPRTFRNWVNGVNDRWGRYNTRLNKSHRDIIIAEKHLQKANGLMERDDYASAQKEMSKALTQLKKSKKKRYNVETYMWLHNVTGKVTEIPLTQSGLTAREISKHLTRKAAKATRIAATVSVGLGVGTFALYKPILSPNQDYLDFATNMLVLSALTALTTKGFSSLHNTARDITESSEIIHFKSKDLRERQDNFQKRWKDSLLQLAETKNNTKGMQRLRKKSADVKRKWNHSKKLLKTIKPSWAPNPEVKKKIWGKKRLAP